MYGRLRSTLTILAAACLFVLPGCRESIDTTAARGVDLENKVLRVGILNDLSGPIAPLGRALGAGLEIYYRQVNAGELSVLPDGWTIESIERDHGYNPQQAVQLYNEIGGDVLFLGMSLGTPTTVPLHPLLERDQMVAVGATLSSRTGENEYTPVFSATYRTEGMRAVDWAVEQAGSDVRFGVVYQQDDLGGDALDGAEFEAEFHGVEIVSRQAVAPGQADFTAVVAGLQAAGAEYVLLGTIPSATGPILGTALQLGYTPTWVGVTPAWLDVFFDPDVIPPAVFANYYGTGSLPFWGEDVPGMAAFLEAYDTHGRDLIGQDWYTLLGYMLAATGTEMFARALATGDVTPEGLLDGIHSIVDWDVNGLYVPISLAEAPYDATRQARIIRPILSERSWEVVSDYAVPQSDGASRTAGGN